MRLVQWYHVATRDDNFYSVVFEADDVSSSGVTCRVRSMVSFNGSYDYFFETYRDFELWLNCHCYEIQKFLKGCYNEKK